MITFPPSRIPAVNVATVPQRSPLRYPGGKTWLVPHIRAWLKDNGGRSGLIVEPFAGGATASLTAVMEKLTGRALMMELDADISAFWQAALHYGEELASLVRRFEPTRDRIMDVLRAPPRDVVEHGFKTLLLNRTRRGGVMAPGAALTKNGENGNGVASRWYPQTLCTRLSAITLSANRIAFRQGDGLALLEEMTAEHTDARFFIDPPYTAGGGKRAGSRLYTHNVIDHARLFEIVAASNADFLMTYDCSDEVVSLVREHRFHAAVVTMKNGHHARVPELVITRERLFA